MWCGVMWRGLVGVVWCGWCSAVWYGVLWCGVVSVVWCCYMIWSRKERGSEKWNYRLKWQRGVAKS